MKGYVGLFRMPGYPWIGQEVTDVLDTAVRVIASADADPLDIARDLSDVLETAARLVRDVGAQALVDAHREHLESSSLPEAS